MAEEVGDGPDHLVDASTPLRDDIGKHSPARRGHEPAMVARELMRPRPATYRQCVL